MSQEKNPVYNTRKATKDKEKRTRDEAVQEAAAVQPEVAVPVALTPVFHTPGSPHARRGLIFNTGTPRREADQTPTPLNSPAKMQRILRESPAVTPVRGNRNAEALPWTPGKFAGSPWVAGSPGVLPLDYDALHQRSPGVFAAILASSPFQSPARAQVQPDAYDTASETLLNYIQTVLGSENIDATEMLRIVTEAQTSVSNALKALPESSARLADVYQEFLGKLNPFIALINDRQRQAQSLTSQDLASFLMTLSAPRQTIKVCI